jgi:hypothetical protein
MAGKAPPILTLKDWEASRARAKLGVADVPPTAEELFEEKVGSWSKKSRFKTLAANIYESRALEHNDSRDRSSLLEAEEVLSSLRHYMDTTAKAVNEADSTQTKSLKPVRESLPDAISVADIRKLKEQRLQAAKRAADASVAEVKAEAARYLPMPPPSPSREPIILPSGLSQDNPRVEDIANKSMARPRSAPGVRGGNILENVRRHNAARFHLNVNPREEDVGFSAFPPPAAAVGSGKDTAADISATAGPAALERLSCRTQESRFEQQQQQQDALDVAMQSGKPQSKPKVVNIVQFGKKQEDWLATVQSKRDELKREIESAEIKEIRAPDVRQTADSWERAKKEHAIQAERQARLDEKTQEAKILKLEQKNTMLKRDIVKSKLLKKPEGETTGGVVKKKVKRKKAKEEVAAGGNMSSAPHPRPMTAGSTSSASRLSHIPSLPDLDALDLLTAKRDHEFASVGRARAQTARASSSTWRPPMNNLQPTPAVLGLGGKVGTVSEATVGAMAALGGEKIMPYAKSSGSESDRAWLERTLKKRKEDQQKRDMQFEMEIADAMNTTITAQYKNSGPIKKDQLGEPSLEDNLYVSDSDDDDDDDEPTTALAPSNSHKLDALITDLDGLRETLQKRISDVPAPQTLVQRPHFDIAAPVLIPVVPVSPRKSPRASTQPPLEWVPPQIPTTNSSNISSIINSNQRARTTEPQDVAATKLRLDIPSTGFLMANVEKSPRKGAAAPIVAFSSQVQVQPPSARAMAAAEVQKEEVSLLAGVEFKNDPLTEALLNRASTAEGKPRSMQRPHSSHLLSQREIHEQRTQREAITSLTRFFDSSSTSDKGRFRLHDARDFIAESMFRKTDILNESVTLLCGTRKDNGAVQIITVLFDRTDFSEAKARAWWLENRDRLIF